MVRGSWRSWKSNIITFMWKVILAMKIIRERDALQTIERISISLFKLNFTKWFWQWNFLSRVFIGRCLHHKCWCPNNLVEQDSVMTFLLELAHHPTSKTIILGKLHFPPIQYIMYKFNIHEYFHVLELHSYFKFNIFFILL